MSTELTTRIWMQETDAKANFLNIVKVISENSNCTNEWKHLSISNGVFGNTVAKHDGIISLNELEAVLSNDPADRFSIYVPFRCWRFDGKIASMENVIFAISCWGEKFGDQFEFDTKVEGNAEVSILNVGPYCALLGEVPEISEINQKVEFNLESLMTLIQQLTQKLDVRKLFTHSDCGKFHFLNSHLAYFKSHTELKNSVNQMVLQLNESEMILEIIQHPWREKDQTLLLVEEIKRKLNAFSESNSPINIEAVTRREKFDFYEIEEQLIFLNYPHFVNGFLDRLFLEFLT